MVSNKARKQIGTMFPLTNGRLIRLNIDGSNGEVFISKKQTMTFGTSILYDHFIKDIDPAKDIRCDISTDNLGRVSVCISYPYKIRFVKRSTFVQYRNTCANVHIN